MFFPWRRAKPLGARGEDIATKTLRREGYLILERNARLGRYEVDIIAQEGDTVAFVEVKTRSAADSVPPEAKVDHRKQQHLERAARIYMSRVTEPDLYFRFDVVAVVLPENGRPQVELFRNAFEGR